MKYEKQKETSHRQGNGKEVICSFNDNEQTGFGLTPQRPQETRNIYAVK